MSAKHSVESERAVTQSESGQDVGDEQFAEIWPAIGTLGVKRPFQAMSPQVHVESVVCCVFHATQGAPLYGVPSNADVLEEYVHSYEGDGYASTADI